MATHHKKQFAKPISHPDIPDIEFTHVMIPDMPNWFLCLCEYRKTSTNTESATRLDIGKLMFLDWPDGILRNQKTEKAMRELAREIVQEIRRN
jgi:hypothetical protein